MKNFIILILLLPFLTYGQETSEPNLYEVVNIKVKVGQEKAFENAVKAHNESFHADGLYRARLFYNVNGPSGGTYSWIMGPTNYAAMDTRPSEGTHDKDWEKVGMYVEEYQPPSYWVVNDKLTQVSTTGTNEKRLIWSYDIKNGQYKRWLELVGKVKEVYSLKRAEETFIVATNEFANTSAGQDAVVIFAFDKWAWMDQKSTFPMLYEEVHGAGSWHHFLNEFNDTVNGRVDWLRYRVN